MKVPGIIQRVLMPLVLDGSSEDGRVSNLDNSIPNTVVTSLMGNGMHAPVIDIDVPCTLVESTTPGHYHLYIDHPMTFDDFVLMLKAMAAAGVVEHGYAGAVQAQGFAAVRLPWVKKGNKQNTQYPPW